MTCPLWVVPFPGWFPELYTRIWRTLANSQCSVSWLWMWYDQLSQVSAYNLLTVMDCALELWVKWSFSPSFQRFYHNARKGTLDILTSPPFTFLIVHNDELSLLKIEAMVISKTTFVLSLCLVKCFLWSQSTRLTDLPFLNTANSLIHCW